MLIVGLIIKKNPAYRKGHDPHYRRAPAHEKKEPQCLHDHSPSSRMQCSSASASASLSSFGA